jgi:hypothetical protein
MQTKTQLSLSRVDTWAVRAAASFWFLAATAYAYLSVQKFSPGAVCFGICFASLAIGVLRMVPWVLRCAAWLFLLSDLLILCGPLNPFFAIDMQFRWDDHWLFTYVSGWLAFGGVLFWLATRTDRVRLTVLEHRSSARPQSG